MSDPDLLALVRAGIHAPSADNTQPWGFKLQGRSISVLHDAARVGLFFDPQGAATLISLGAVCENMLLEAGRRGLSASLERSATPLAPGAWAFRVHLQPGGARAEPLADAISTRRTHRFLFQRGASVAAGHLESLAAALHPCPGVHLAWAESRRARAQLTRAAFLADLVRYSHRQSHMEFHATLRFGAAIDARGDGLGADTLGIERPLLPLLRLLEPWWLARGLNRLGLHYVMAWRGSVLPMGTASRLGVLHADPSCDWFDQGRALQRVWLAATRAGLDLQPLGALPLLLVRREAGLDDSLTPLHRRRLAEADGLWRAAVEAPRGARALMLLRVGRARAAAPRARRRPLDGFLLP